LVRSNGHKFEILLSLSLSLSLSSVDVVGDTRRLFQMEQQSIEESNEEFKLFFGVVSFKLISILLSSAPGQHPFVHSLQSLRYFFSTLFWGKIVRVPAGFHFGI